MAQDHVGPSRRHYAVLCCASQCYLRPIIRAPVLAADINNVGFDCVRLRQGSTRRPHPVGQAGIPTRCVYHQLAHNALTAWQNHSCKPRIMHTIGETNPARPPELCTCMARPLLQTPSPRTVQMPCKSSLLRPKVVHMAGTRNSAHEQNPEHTLKVAPSLNPTDSRLFVFHKQLHHLEKCPDMGTCCVASGLRYSSLIAYLTMMLRNKSHVADTTCTMHKVYEHNFYDCSHTLNDKKRQCSLKRTDRS